MTTTLHHPTKESALAEVFHSYSGPAFAIRLWDGFTWSSSPSRPPACTIVVTDPSALTALLAHPNEVTLGEAFIHGDIDVEGDLFSVFPVTEFLFDRPRSLQQKIAERLSGAAFETTQLLHHGAVNSRARDSASIAYHYDLPVAFFEPWLGSSLVYSCACFEHPGDSLNTAQQQKLDLICRKLRLQPGERFLDIGCGWGSLVLHAASAFQARAQGITLSKEQASVAQSRVKSAGLLSNCAIHLRDYRELDTASHFYDKIASIGMSEHVGLKHLPLYFEIVCKLLRPGGVFLNHAIARSATAPARESSFIDRYVFPDGRLVTLSETIAAAEAQGFEVRDVENLREHYELTLRHWAQGLQQHAHALLQLVPRTTYRIWLLYTAGSAAAFRRGAIAVHQVLLSRPDHGKSGLPLTRRDWYPPPSL